ncbi:FAD-dependent monooxygenase [Phanerochaete sordida]|uniref:FAD-dependent monooxygenase n=1 Tax=Phanerochaete sordida TaxID=48140 RepID=A0A9P3GK20_9APHY|nr:FAD-dependent monooxygenase [Phanerochaete sordida]
MSPTRVGIIGAGIAGPVAAMLLKQQGYAPTLYERLDAPSEAGLGLGLQHAGLEVLARIPGLLAHIDGYAVDEIHFYSVLPADAGLLGVSDHPRRLRAAHSLGHVSVQRPLLHARLVEYAARLGVPVKFGHKLARLEQDAEGVTMVFSNGATETASFVVGCDGLHSNTRSCLFGETPADYTGLSQWGGISPTPDFWKGKRAIADLFGDGTHMIAVPMSDTLTMWAASQREPEAKEEWRALDAATTEHFKQYSQYSQWPYGAGELVRSSLKIIRYGLYDRPALPTWHQGRVVLIGDAAHPTSPHVGMGASNAWADAALLADLLQTHNPRADAPSADTLAAVFGALEAVRLPHTAETVRRARAHGEVRTAAGAEACRARNAMYREMCADPEKLRARFGLPEEK